MPWNDNANPGPWGSPPSGDAGERKDPRKHPPGGPRRPGGPGGPDLNAGLNNLRNRMRGFLGGPGQGVRPGAIAAIAGAAFALWALSGLYQVASNEEAVVTRFGAFDRVEAPGLRYHLPSPLEHVEKVAVTSLNRLDIGGSGTADGDIPQESLMLTSDENIVDLDFSVTWRVSNAAQFVFTTRAPDDAVKAVAESAMRDVIGKPPLDAIPTNGRGQAQLATAALMQSTLDSW